MIIHDVPQNTTGWAILRSGKPTASNFKSLITSKGGVSKSLSEYAKDLAGDSIAGAPIDNWGGSRSTQRGQAIEPVARAGYAFSTEADIQTVGFITDDLIRYGCSPDSLVGDDGLLEIKCCEKKGHITNVLYIDKHGRPPTEYVAQCMGQLMITGRDWLDLMFYHPELGKAEIRILPDQAFFTVLKQQINAVIIERDRIIKVMEKYL